MYFASLLVNGAAFAGGDLQDIPLRWTPTSTLASMGTIDISGNIVATAIHIDTFADTRENPSLVAENREKEGKFRQMTTSSDVAASITG